MKSRLIKSNALKRLSQRVSRHYKQWLKPRQSAFYLRVLVVGGLSLWTLTGLILPAQRRTAKAAEIELARASNPWSFASFPVENFQAY
ncbi:MAG: M23 family peptidase, partial [Cyanobacteria bacterium J06642_11]